MLILFCTIRAYGCLGNLQEVEKYQNTLQDLCTHSDQRINETRTDRNRIMNDLNRSEHSRYEQAADDPVGLGNRHA